MTALSAVRAHYDVATKVAARDIVVRAARTGQTETALDLWGGGASARALLDAFQDIAVVSCEVDPELWPSLRLDAQQRGYVPHCGPFQSAKGKYDLVWLDLCGQWSTKARDLITAGARMVTDRGLLAVTLLAARDDPGIAADRLWTVPASLERHTGMRVVTLYPYNTKSPMWLVILAPVATVLLGYADNPRPWTRASSWSLEPQWAPYPHYPGISAPGDGMGAIPFEGVLESMREYGYFDTLRVVDDGLDT